MARLRRVVEAGHAARNQAAVKVRHPLASVAIADAPLAPDLEAILLEELNVKEARYEGEGGLVTLDTRITEELQKREPDHALAEASRAVVDWEGGTKIGASLDLFVRTWGRRGLCRGAIVVICSDGLERGHPELLETAMERLARLSHRIVWMNPLKGDNEAFRPRTVGMLAALPYIDLLLSGHDLSSLEELAECLPHLA